MLLAVFFAVLFWTTKTDAWSLSLIANASMIGNSYFLTPAFNTVPLTPYGHIVLIGGQNWQKYASNGSFISQWPSNFGPGFGRIHILAAETVVIHDSATVSVLNTETGIVNWVANMGPMNGLQELDFAVQRNGDGSGLVVIASDSPVLQALDLKYGHNAWNVTAPNANEVFHSVVAFDALAPRQPSWTPYGIFALTCSPDGGKFVALYKIDPGTGKIIWTIQYPIPTQGCGVRSSLVLGNTLILCKDGTIGYTCYGIDPQTGINLWNVPFQFDVRSPARPEIVPLKLNYRELFVVVNDTALLAFDTQTGKPEWTTTNDLGSNNYYLPCCPVARSYGANSQRLIAAIDRTNVTLYDGNSGQILASASLGGLPLAGPIFSDDDQTIYIMSGDQLLEYEISQN